MKPMNIVYRVGDNAYVNLTNRCSSACTFCVRTKQDGVGTADSLWLDHEPSLDEAIAALDAFGIESVNEVVFCGYGEPTEAFDRLKEVAAYIKNRWGKRTRLNTNGQGSLINGRDITPELEDLIDHVSISLNTPNAQRYLEVTRSRFGAEAFPAMLEFARSAGEYVSRVTLSTVQTVLTAEEEAECARICADLGAEYRIRELWE